jgi:hypothetical protein
VNNVSYFEIQATHPEQAIEFYGGRPAPDPIAIRIARLLIMGK